MRLKTVQWIVLVTSVLTAVIIFIQLYWLNKVYSLEQKTFNMNVVKAIRGVYEDVALLDSSSELNLQGMIEHPSPDYFLFKVDQLGHKDTMAHYMKAELEDFDVLTDVYMAAREKGSNSYSHIQFISTAASRYEEDPLQPLKLFPVDKDYVLLYFPHRNKYILSQMTLWFVSTGMVILALTGLAISLFFFYRQKFLAETQRDFVNNFTHEFKTPLAVMKIASGVLLDPDMQQKPEKLHQYAGIIEQQTSHLQQQVERLLTMATQDNRPLTPVLKDVAINRMIQQAVQQIEPLIKARGGQVTLELDENDPVISGDEAHLQLALVNLIENGLKYSNLPRLVVSSQWVDDTVSISVKDNGIGIDKKYHKNLFRKFYRVPTGDVHNVKGFGLGLNFVKQVVDAHHGKIQLESVPGIGTAFKLLFPHQSIQS